MIHTYKLKPLDAVSVTLLQEFYNTLTAKRASCYFCNGGNTCICGSCPESEFHDADCLVNTLDRLFFYHRREKCQDGPVMALLPRESVEWYRERIEELEEALEELKKKKACR